MKRFVPRDWGDFWEMILTVASLYSGLIYLVGPDRLRSIYVFVNQYGEGTQGMQVMGAIWLAGGMLILAGRVMLPRPTVLRRIGHALSAGTYFLMGLGLFVPVFVGGPVSTGAAFVPYWLVTTLHVYFGTHEPRLTRRRGSLREG